MPLSLRTLAAGLGLSLWAFHGAPAQVIVAPSRTVVVAPPRTVVVPAPTAVVVRPGYDAYQDALGRLRSRHANSRRDGAVTLGRYGDPRAVPDLVWLLQNDRDADVRTAAAFSLGAIGDARAAGALRGAASNDHNKKVRQAANHAFGKIMFEAPVVTAAPAAVIGEAIPAPVELEAAPPLSPPR